MTCTLRDNNEKWLNTHKKYCVVNIARFLKYVWQELNIFFNLRVSFTWSQCNTGLKYVVDLWCKISGENRQESHYVGETTGMFQERIAN